MRGQVAVFSCRVGAHRITPAYAGKSVGTWQQRGECPDHPRVCGEKALSSPSRYPHQGSPPRMRGKGRLGGIALLMSRITPAYAGKRLKRSRSTVSPVAIVPLFPSVCNKPVVSDGSPAGRDAPLFLPADSACRSGRIMPGISFLSVSSAHNGHQPKAIGLAAPHALTQQCPELLCIGHL